jgi:hypothetical protein
MRAAIAALRQQCPSKLVIAVPTAAPSSGDELRTIADEVVAVMMPEPFYADQMNGSSGGSRFSTVFSSALLATPVLDLCFAHCSYN